MMSTEYNKSMRTLTDSFVKSLWRSVAPWILFAILIQFVWFVLPLGRDSTDGSGRSNLEIRTDCLTGLQYLTSSKGGLTPRIGNDGKQIKMSCS